MSDRVDGAQLAEAVTVEAQCLIDCHAGRINQPPGAHLSKVFELAEAHWVLPSVCHKVQHWSAAAEASMRDFARSAFCLTSELTGVLEAFSIADIPVMPLKGPVFAEKVYGDVALRTYNDLDLLVQPHDFARADLLLAEIGFKGSFALLPKAQYQRLYHRENTHWSCTTMSRFL